MTDGGESDVTPAQSREVVAEYENEMFEYAEHSDGTASILRYIGSATSVTVPDELDGLKVVEMGTRTFSIATY